MYLLNKFSRFKALWKSIYMTLARLVDFLITRVSPRIDFLTCFFFCTFIRSLRSQPRLNLRHVSNNKMRCETRKGKKRKRRNSCSQNYAFCTEMKLRWFLCAFWTEARECKKLYTVTTIPCVPRFHAQTVRILYPIRFYVQTIRTSPLAAVSSWDFAVRSTVSLNIQFAGTYGIRVKNCFAFNKLNSSVQLIDDKG